MKTGAGQSRSWGGDGVLREVALGVIVLGAVVRLVSTHSRLPWWEVDPSREFLVETTLRPSQGLMLDAAVWLAAAVGAWASVAAGDRLRWKSAVLVLLGAFGAVVMSQRFVRAGTGPDDVFLGSAWAAAMVGAWAVTQVSSGLSSRRVVVGLAAAFGGVAFVLAGKGVYQVLVEHAQTVAQYKANAAAMLTAQGIEPGSAGAREFERRLMQAEATGWVGLSNAHASILSACLALTLGFAIDAWRSVRAGALASGVAGVVSLGVAASAAGLAITFSKGGFAAGAVAVGVVTAGVLLWDSRGRRWVGIGAAALPVLALVAVGLRGLIGERIGELSLLFRSQYLAGAVRIIGESLPWGVGPGGFKSAYALAKPALSPETVESPHSVLLDWTATLGVFGIAWCPVLGAWVAMGARGFVSREVGADGQHGSETRATGRGGWCVAAPVLGFVIAWVRETPTVLPDEWAVRVVGALGCAAFVVCAWRVPVGRGLAAGVFGAAAALATHAQIEMTPILPATAGVFLLLVGLGASGAGGAAPAGEGARGGWPRRVWESAVGFGLVAGAVIVGRECQRAIRWESALREAAESVRDIASVRRVVAGMEAATGPGGDVAAFRRELASVGVELTESAPGTRAAVVGFVERAADRADASLGRASAVLPRTLRAEEARVRLRLGVALDAKGWGADQAARLIESASDAVLRADVLGEEGGARAMAGGSAAAYQALAGLTRDRSHLQNAAERWRAAAARDPWALTPLLRLIDVLEALGDGDGAKEAARRALVVDENLRLDPLKRMPPAVRERVERLAGE